jgi:hypothetical protein
MSGHSNPNGAEAMATFGASDTAAAIRAQGGSRMGGMDAQACPGDPMQALYQL